MLIKHMLSKQYKRKKNAFYILNFLVSTNDQFQEIALSQFKAIKEGLFSNIDVKKD